MLSLGKNEKISNEAYHEDREYVSSTGLKLILKDPKAFYDQYVLGVRQESSKAMDFGTYLHALILEPETIENTIAIWDGTRQGNAYKEFAEQNKDKIIITKSQELLASSIIQRYEDSMIVVGKHGYEEAVPIPTFFEGGEAEETMCAEIDGVKVKVRFDYRKEFDTFGSINDVKTTSWEIENVGDAVKVCRAFDYDISAALYCDIAEIVTGKKHDFYYLFVGTKTPFTHLFRASEEFLNEGRTKYREAIRRLKQARETGTYYDNKIPEIPALEKPFT